VLCSKAPWRKGVVLDQQEGDVCLLRRQQELRGGISTSGQKYSSDRRGIQVLDPHLQGFQQNDLVVGSLKRTKFP